MRCQTHAHRVICLFRDILRHCHVLKHGSTQRLRTESRVCFTCHIADETTPVTSIHPHMNTNPLCQSCSSALTIVPAKPQRMLLLSKCWIIIIIRSFWAQKRCETLKIIVQQPKLQRGFALFYYKSLAVVPPDVLGRIMPVWTLCLSYSQRYKLTPSKTTLRNCWALRQRREILFQATKEAQSHSGHCWVVGSYTSQQMWCRVSPGEGVHLLAWRWLSDIIAFNSLDRLNWQTRRLRCWLVSEWLPAPGPHDSRGWLSRWGFWAQSRVLCLRRM